MSSARMSRLPPHRHRVLAIAVCALGLALTGCGSSKKEKKLANYEPESFASTSTHSRNYAASEAQTCEAARRALLSQGYQVKDASAQQVSGVKSFQPENEVHMELSLRVVCAKDARGGGSSASASEGGKSTTAFVSALQDRYALKKTSNSAGVGVGVLGSISLPYSSSDDTLVKVASQTVTDERFYERFYALVDRYLVADGPDPQPPPAAPSADAGKPEGGKPETAR